MGIRLDWQIESEQTNTRATEDPAVRQRRLRARNQFLLLIAGVSCLLGLAVLAVIWRLRSVDTHYRQDLLDTVEIETTALRLGDLAGYMAIQRSASSSFLLDQNRVFDEYQTLKQQNRIVLTGTVIDATIDDLRGRVVVEEQIDGVPYHVVWFYWYYTEPGGSDQGGWRRVPDDLTFWGDEQQIERENVVIDYRELDQALAEALAERLDTWWVHGSALIGCVPAHKLAVEIVAETPASVAWVAEDSAEDSGRLRITSPLVERARADLPIPPDLARRIAQAVAAQQVNTCLASEITAPAISDAAWLRQDVERWLAEMLLAGPDAPPAEPGFTGSLVAQYGAGAPMIVLDVGQQGATNLDGAFVALTGLTLNQISPDQLNNLDWSDFFQWRLALEFQLLAQLDGRDAFLSLYDLEDLNASATASVRLGDPLYAARTIPAIQRVTVTSDTVAGRTYAYTDVSASAEDGTISETILWRVASGTWKRAN